MAMIIHKGRFMDAVLRPHDCVAAVWDQPHGGQIIDYIYLGQYADRPQALQDCDAQGLKLRQNQIMGFGPAVSINGYDYPNPHHIHVYK